MPKSGDAILATDGALAGSEASMTETEMDRLVKPLRDQGKGFSLFSAPGCRFQAPGPPEIDPGRETASGGPQKGSGDRF